MVLSVCLTLYCRIFKNIRRAGEMAQLIECLCSTHKNNPGFHPYHRQEDQEFKGTLSSLRKVEGNLGYMRPSLKKKNTTNNK